MERSEAATQPDANQATEELFHRLAERNWKGRIVSIQHLRDLKEEIERRCTQGVLDKEFYQERLTFFDFRIPDDLPKAKSLIIVAVPRPQSQAVFTLNGEQRALIIPPTYVGHEKTRVQMEKFMTEILAPKGYRVALAKLPLKLLAVRSGLGTYGRNNICYVPDMGSFLQLVAFYSDLACEKDIWQEPQMMHACRDCHACRQSCPADAIPSDRFLLHAERCLVFHNERKGDIPFPAWIDASWHNCLVGCMRCQRVCPENKRFLRWIEESVDFSEEETALLLKGGHIEQLPVTTKRKLERLDLLEDADTLPRNLEVFFGEPK